MTKTLSQRIADEFGWTVDGVEPYVEAACVTEAEWTADPEDCMSRVRAAMEDMDGAQ